MLQGNILTCSVFFLKVWEAKGNPQPEQAIELKPPRILDLVLDLVLDLDFSHTDSWFGLEGTSGDLVQPSAKCGGS